jgi:hypothetical protein
VLRNSWDGNCVLPWRLRNTAGLVLLLRASISPFQVVVYSNIPALIGQSTTLESNRPTGSCFTGHTMGSIRSSKVSLCSYGYHTMMFSRLLLPSEANLVVLTITVNRIFLLLGLSWNSLEVKSRVNGISRLETTSVDRQSSKYLKKRILLTWNEEVGLPILYQSLLLKKSSFFFLKATFRISRYLLLLSADWSKICSTSKGPHR